MSQRRAFTRSAPPPADLVGPDPWYDVHQAAAYLRLGPSGVRTAIARGHLLPDGRGGRRVAMFRRSTLDRFLTERVHEHQATGVEPHEDARRAARRAGGVPSARLLRGPEDRTKPGARQDREGSE